MKEDFRPSQIQIDYLHSDILDHLEELGFDVENKEYSIGSITWYNWDNKPRWFIFLNIFDFSKMKKGGYIEIDVYGEAYNGPEQAFAIDHVEIPGHGYPCSGIEIVRWDMGLDELVIVEQE